MARIIGGVGVLLVILGVALQNYGGLIPDITPSDDPAHKSVVDYARGLADAYRSVASSIESGDITRDTEANAKLDALQAAARRKAFDKTIGTELQRAVKDGKWQPDEAAKVLRQLADGFDEVN